MWLFTDRGFISVVAYNEKKDVRDNLAGKLSRRGRKRLGRSPMLARARVRADLEQLRPYFSYLQIQDVRDADYRYRALIPRKAFADFAGDRAGAIDYDSHFKEVASERSAKTSPDRHQWYMQVWSAGYQVQSPTKHSSYSGGSSTYGALCPMRDRDGNGAWCSYSNHHRGKHSFEVGATAPATTTSPYSTKSQTGLCDRKHATRGWCTFTSHHLGGHSWAASSDPGPDDREAGAADVDTVGAMADALMGTAPDAIRVDPLTPMPAFDLWALAGQTYEGAERLSEKEVADLLVELLTDERTPSEDREEYLTKLTHMGYVVGDAEGNDGATAPLAKSPGTGAETELGGS
jgi:hypothetical protein